MSTPTPISSAPTLAGDQTPPVDHSSDGPPSVAPSLKGDRQAHDAEHQSSSDDIPRARGDGEKAVQQTVFASDNVVDWDGPDDHECPRNWPALRKFAFVIVTSSMIAVVSFGSSVFAPAEKTVAAQFDVSLTVAQLGVSLWILGFFAGPIFFGPMSEIFGHIIPLSIGITGVAIFQIPIAVGENLRTILVSRFFSGAFGSGVFAVVSGTYFELYEPIPRGVALATSAVCINLGATIAPIVGAYTTYDVQWRWTAWLTMIFALCLCLAALFIVRETSSRRILRLKARRLRFQTKNWALHAKSEETKIEFHDILQRYLTKPIRMFVSEPILISITAYLTLVYGTLYLSFQAFPVAYQQRGWSVETSELPFIAVILGILSALGSFSIFTLTWYKRRVIANNSVAVPEFRLPPMILGAIVLPPSLLWFGWSGNVHWISQVIASFFIGFGLLLIFITGIVYIVDVYQGHANSAMSIHVVVRSLVACAFPLFANIMYDHLGVAWGSSLLALLAIVMLPAPILFYVYGGKIRSWSRFSYAS